MELVSVRELARRRGVSHVAINKRIKRGDIPEEAFVVPEGKTRPLIDYDMACFALDAMVDAGKQMAQKAKKDLTKNSTPKKQAAKTKPKAEEPNKNGNGNVAGKENDVKTGEADDKPKENQSKASKHTEQLRAQKFDGLVLDETSGYYFADDVEIEEFEGKKIVTAKDVLLTNAEKYQKHRALTEALKAEQLQMKLDIDKGILIDGEALKKKIFKIATETRDAIQNIPEQFGPDLLACKDLIELQTTLSHAINKALENLGRL